jgi:hypothetical protein
MSLRRFDILSDAARSAIIDVVREAPIGWVVTLSPPPKSRSQEEMYHGIISTISKSATFLHERRDPETWKRLLVDAYVKEARLEAKAGGLGDPFAGHTFWLPSLDGSSIVPMGVRTRHFSKSQASEFIEYILAFSAENGISGRFID